MSTFEVVTLCKIGAGNGKFVERIKDEFYDDDKEQWHNTMFFESHPQYCDFESPLKRENFETMEEFIKEFMNQSSNQELPDYIRDAMKRYKGDGDWFYLVKLNESGIISSFIVVDK